MIVNDRSECEVSGEDEDQSSMLGEVLSAHLLKNAVVLFVFSRNAKSYMSLDTLFASGWCEPARRQQ